MLLAELCQRLLHGVGLPGKAKVGGRCPHARQVRVPLLQHPVPQRLGFENFKGLASLRQIGLFVLPFLPLGFGY